MGTKYISRKKNRRGNWVKYRDDRLVTAQQSTGAAQIANLKYILKNGSTGEFVEALDSIINERVRVALGQLVNNLDKGTGLAKVLGIDASNDLGSSSIANLASVLFVSLLSTTPQGIVSGTSFNNITEAGLYLIMGDAMDYPDNNQKYGFLIVWNSVFIYQEYLTTYGYKFTRASAAAGWTPWRYY